MDRWLSIETNYIRRVAENVRAARTAAGLTQAEAAARARLDRRFWIRIEAGEVNLTLRTVASVAVALDVDPSEFAVPHDRAGTEKSAPSE